MTQNERLLEYLEASRAVDPLMAWERLGIYRLSARIKDLRDQGHVIHTDTFKVRNRFGEDVTVALYSLESDDA